MPRRLCIVSGNLVRCDAFIPALTSLSRDDELEIVMDRRRGAAFSGAVSRPADERRFRPYLDLALKVDGFAIVPWSPTPPVPAPAPAFTPTPVSTPPAWTPAPPPAAAAAAAPEFTAPTPLRFAPASPLDRLVIDEDEADRERLERILRFKPRRRFGPWAMFVFVAAIVIALFATMPTVRSRVTSLLPDAPRSAQPDAPRSAVPDAPRSADQPRPPGQAEDTRVATQTLPSIPQAPSTEKPAPAASPADGTAGSEPTAGNDSLTLPALTRESGTRAARPRSAPATTPRAVPAPIASASVTSPTPAGPITREMSPSLPGVPRVELSRGGARSTEGETYTVRVSDVGGRPLAGADILLLARMADGTAASIPLSSGAEPGTYQGTMPSGRSSLVDLRVRVTTSDKRVEIPFAP